MPDTSSPKNILDGLLKGNRRRASFIILVAVGIVLSFVFGFYFNESSRLPGGLLYHPPPFVVAAAGDWGCGTDTDRTVTNIEEKDPGVVLALGDFGYQGSDFPGNKCSNTVEWEKSMKHISKNLYNVIGNHDIAEKTIPNLLNIYLNYFGWCISEFFLSDCPVGTYYSFNQHRVHFLILNSEFGWKKGTAQFSFADKDLRTASSDPDTDWIIVAYHSARYAAIDDNLDVNIFRYGLEHQYPRPFDGSNYVELSKDFVDTYHPIFDRYGVDLVLQAHVHNYQRTYPLKYIDKDNLPQITSTAKDVYVHPKGEIYLTVGTGGAQNYKIIPGSTFISGLWNVYNRDDDYYLVKTDDSHYGFLELQFSKEKKALLGTFYGNDPNKGSIVLDQFSIEK